MRTLIIAILALVATTVIYAPAPASAHSCASYQECDARDCPEEENHDHTDYNHIGKDEHCKSEVEQEEKCYIAGEQYHPKFCALVPGEDDIGPQQPGDVTLPVALPSPEP